ncbi:MAG TPA: 4-hydroxy-tetrahydrodipicolinate reductase [Candidatus Limnocylindria bacterium]|nr:4-hydroxy-tetrahydrodipicolinate reductase [Candidatus Limnocylindria bacterium]
MIALVLVGASGRMGRAIEDAARASGDFTIKSRFGRDDPIPVAADAASWAGPGEVVVEFSSPAGAVAAARACAAFGAGLVSGTTGLSVEDEEELERAATRVPVLRAANFSLGVLALRRALGAALDVLPSGWDVEIVERHHRGKLDSPSGTALQLARDVGERRGIPEPALRHGRVGRAGPRPESEIGMHALRGGNWVGDHTVLMAGPGEWLELRHVAQDRGAFAHGVLSATRFVVTAAPGLYNLEDVV